MGNEQSISNVICDDQKAVLAQLSKFTEADYSLERFKELQRCLETLSACNFAKELTIYEYAKLNRLLNVEAYIAYQAMLDNMVDTIASCGHRSTAIVYEVAVLRVLLSNHIEHEHDKILPLVESEISREVSVELAARYERCVVENCDRAND